VNAWKLYRTRLLVKARRLTQPCTFTDAYGRVHRGAPGDYLMESDDGSMRVSPPHIFEDIYVELRPHEVPLPLALVRPRNRTAKGVK